jgi:hypothetical protein
MGVAELIGDRICGVVNGLPAEGRSVRARAAHAKGLYEVKSEDGLTQRRKGAKKARRKGGTMEHGRCGADR